MHCNTNVSPASTLCQCLACEIKRGRFLLFSLKTKLKRIMNTQQAKLLISSKREVHLSHPFSQPLLYLLCARPYAKTWESQDMRQFLLLRIPNLINKTDIEKQTTVQNNIHHNSRSHGTLKLSKGGSDKLLQELSGKSTLQKQRMSRVWRMSRRSQGRVCPGIRQSICKVKGRLGELHITGVTVLQ